MCLLTLAFPDDCGVTFTQREDTGVPFIQAKCETLKLKPDHPALVIYDEFNGFYSFPVWMPITLMSLKFQLLTTNGFELFYARNSMFDVL